MSRKHSNGYNEYHIAWDDLLNCLGDNLDEDFPYDPDDEFSHDSQILKDLAILMGHRSDSLSDQDPYTPKKSAPANNKLQRRLHKTREEVDKLQNEAREKNVPFILDTPLSKQASDLKLNEESEIQLLEKFKTILRHASDEQAAFTMRMASPYELTEYRSTAAWVYPVLDDEQGFQYWRKHIKQGLPMPCNLKYIHLFTRELFLGIGAGSPKEGLDLLLLMLRSYSDYALHPLTTHLLCLTIPLFCLRFQFPLPPEAFNLFPADLVISAHYDLWVNAVLLDPQVKTLPVQAVLLRSTVDLTSGASWTYDSQGLLNHLEELMSFLDQKYQEQLDQLDPYLDNIPQQIRRKGGLLDHAGVPCKWTFDFLKDDLDLPPAFLKTTGLYDFGRSKNYLSCLAGSADVSFRKVNGLKGTRSTRFKDGIVSVWVNEFTKLKKKGLSTKLVREKEVLKLDPALISQLRKESENVREALKTEEDTRLTKEKTDSWLASMKEETRSSLFSLINENASASKCRQSLADQLQALEANLEHPLFVDNGKQKGKQWNPELLAFITKSSSFEEWKKRKLLSAVSDEESAVADLIASLPLTHQKALKLIAKGPTEEAENLLLEEGSFLDMMTEEINDLFLDAGLDVLLIEDENAQLILNPEYESQTGL